MTNMKNKYTDEINIQILISLLKQHGIRKIIASPGTTNLSFIASIQQDNWFEIFSAVDERAASYMANGLAEESGEIVVLSCTGATASRNYLPGLTEAYYRKLPIIAITSTQNIGKIGQYASQVIDRTIQFPDLVKTSVQIPTIYSSIEKEYTIRKINEAILECTHNMKGPVHINLATIYSQNYNVEKIPVFRKIDRIQLNNTFPTLPQGKIGIYIWSHLPMTKQETNAIDKFCEVNNAVVICDLVSNYYGKFRFLATLTNSQEKDLGTKKFDLIINIGYVHGNSIPVFAKEEWRVNPDGIIRDRDNNLTKVFEMEEIEFFKHYCTGKSANCSLKKICDENYRYVFKKIPDLPFSNMWIAKNLSKDIPPNSILHLGILNSLRCWNYFEIGKDINCYTNSGGYGIDGCLSSFIGACYTHSEGECYLIIGDLSFFYDVNTIINKVPNNAHILVVNNGVGTEFKNYNHPAAKFGVLADNFIAAKGHNGFKSKTLLQDIARVNNFRYLSAFSKEEFINSSAEWLKSSNSPIIMEVFTNDFEESKAIQIMNTLVCDNSLKGKLKKTKFGRYIKKLIGRG